MVCIADDTKLVDHLGRFPLPIEVVQYGWQATRRSVSALLRDLGYDVEIVRRVRDGEPVVTDSGNFILDAHMELITDKATLDTNLNWIAGVVEHGLFTGIAHEVLMASPSGESRLIELPHRNAARIPEWRKCILDEFRSMSSREQSMTTYLMGIDAGTTGCKTCIFDLDGHLIGTDYREYPCYYPHPGWVEQLPEDLTPTLFDCVRAAIRDAGVPAEEIKALSVSTQGSVFGALDEGGKLSGRSSAGRTRGASTTWGRNRDGEYIDPGRLYQISGYPISTVPCLTKYLWFKDNEPENFAATVRHLPPSGLLPEGVRRGRLLRQRHRHRLPHGRLRHRRR